MKRVYKVSLVSVTVLLLAVTGLAQTGTPVCKLLVVTDRPEALYSVGEKVKFLITLTQDDVLVSSAELAFQLDKDGMPPVNCGILKLENGAASVEGSLPEPGFLTCRITFTNAEHKVLTALAAAGIEPEKLAPSLPVPDDFDAFWAKQKALLRAVPMQPILTSVPSTNAGIECFDVQIPCHTGAPVSAYLARPSGAVPYSLPIILSVHGAGVRSSTLSTAANLAGSYNALAMDLNANGIPNGQSAAYYKELSQTGLKDYPFRGRDDREQCYFLGMFLRLVRAIDFLTSQPEWDGKHLIVTGISQGGGQSIAAAGLDSRVTLICASVPALCDHSGKAVGRANGWPRLVPDVNGKPDPKILEETRYFDCVNFATRVKAEAVLSAGFIDTICAPSSVYTAYNALPGSKQITNQPLIGHRRSPQSEAAEAAAIKRHIKQ